MPAKEALPLVNAWLNDRRRFPYMPDKGRDHWLTLWAFLTGGRNPPDGRDCEDYAIAKYFTLLAAGFTDAEMRLVAVRERRGRRRMHMVLAVRPAGGAAVMLDNQLRKVTPISRAARHYKAHHWFNATHWWR